MRFDLISIPGSSPDFETGKNSVSQEDLTSRLQNNY